MTVYRTDTNQIQFHNADAMILYAEWDSPIVIIYDGPYGVKGSMTLSV